MIIRDTFDEYDIYLFKKGKEIKHIYLYDRLKDIQEMISNKIIMYPNIEKEGMVEVFFLNDCDYIRIIKKR